MPNWCSNTVTLWHSDPKMITRAVRAYTKQKLLHEFVPVPDALSGTTAGHFSDPARQAELNALNEHNLATYGYQNWYDFCRHEWALNGMWVTAKTMSLKIPRMKLDFISTVLGHRLLLFTVRWKSWAL